MVDSISAVGMAASVGQLAELTATIARGLWRYYDDVTKAPAWCQALREELSNLTGLLDALAETLGTEQETGRKSSSLVRNVVKPLNVAIRDLERRIQPPRKPGTLQKLKWPLTQVETDLLVSKIKRHEKLLTMALQVEQR